MARVILAFACLIVVACGSSPTAPPAVQHVVSGTVRSNASGALAGASVRVESGPDAGRSVLTNAEGRYTISLREGAFTLRASAPDHSLADKAVTLTADTVVDFDLRKIGS